MKNKLKNILRKPAIWVLLAVELLILGSALAAALRPAVVYEFSTEQWEKIAANSEINYDDDGRIGVTEMTDGEDILQTPVMTLPKGHYKITLDYYYKPSMDADGLLHHAGLYFKAEEDQVTTGEIECLDKQYRHGTVVLNVRNDSDTVRLIARNDGGIFTVGAPHIEQNKVYAWACVLGWLLLFTALDVLLLLAVPGSPFLVKDAELCGCAVILLAAVALVCAPMLMNGGGLQGADWIFHTSRVEGIAQGLREGQFPVRVYSQANDGYGYAPSLFYGELLLYFPAVLRLLGVSVQGAYRAYVIAVQLLTAGIAFFSLRQIFKNNKAALFGSVLYILSAYHIHNIYWRSAVGEYTALAFLPLIPAALCLLYGKEAPTRRQAHTACAELTVAFSALVQSHMITLELAALLCAVFGLLHLRRTFTKQVIGVWLGAAVLVVLLNLWFLVPFASVMLGGGYSGMFSGTDGQFIGAKGIRLTDLLIWREDFNCIGADLAAGCAVFFFCWFTRRDTMPEKERRIGLWSACAGLLACWMCTDTFPWGTVGRLPVLGKLLLAIQFPWRYLSVATLLLVIAAVCAVRGLRGTGYARPAAAVLLAMSLLGVGLFNNMYMPEVKDRYVGDRGSLLYANSKLSNMAWYFDKLYLPDEAFNHMGRDEFACPTAVTTVEIAEVTKENGITTLSCSEVKGELGYAELPLLYYPGYTELDGNGIVFRTENGMVGVTVPAGYSGYIRVAFREPKRWLAADLVSLVTLAALAGAAVRKKKKMRK